MLKIIKDVFYKLESSSILMFHHIDDGAIVQKSGCVLSINKFLEILDSGLEFASVIDLVKHRYRNSGKCAITFDDGLQDIYRVAYPELKRRNIPFTIFVVSNFIDCEGYISSVQLKELANDSLVTIGSHGVTHKLLKGMSIENQCKELIESKTILERIVNKPIRLFAYSHGQFDSNTLKILRRNRVYSYAFGVKGYPLNIITKRKKYDLPRINCENKCFNYKIVKKKSKTILQKKFI